MILAKTNKQTKQTHRLKEQNSNCRSKPTNLQPIDLWQSAKNINWKKIVGSLFNKTVLGKLDIHMQKNETRPQSLIMYTNQLKIDWISKYKTWSHELLEENKGVSYQDIVMDKDVLDQIPKAQETIANMDTLGGIRWWLKCLGLYHPPGRLEMNSRLLDSVWPRASCCRHLEKKPADGRSFSLFHVNKIIKNINKKMGIHQTKEFLHTKETFNSKETTYRMEENICK